MQQGWGSKTKVKRERKGRKKEKTMNATAFPNLSAICMSEGNTLETSKGQKTPGRLNALFCP